MELSLKGFKGWWSELLTSCLGTTKASLESVSGRGECPSFCWDGVHHLSCCYSAVLWI